MATTITALGTVPQKLVDVGSTLTTSYANVALFDSHGAESIGFMHKYTQGGETSVQLVFEGLLRQTGEWVALPISSSAVILTDAAGTSRAFQLRVSADIQQIRIRGKYTGGTVNGTTRVEIWGMLSAPTFPIIGLIY